MNRVFVVLASVLVLAACSEKSEKAASPALDIDNPKSLYRVETKAPARVKAGERGTLTLAVQPREGAKVKPETPFKTKLSATAPVELAKTELGYQDHARVEGNGPVFEVPFDAKDAGAGNIEADMTFFVCTDEACVRTTEQLQVPVTVQE
jgi:hypothetical protein